MGAITVAGPKTQEGVYQTCRLTVVTPGQSDRVIKIYPAEHESEKVWLDNTQGIERWEAIKRLMFTDAERGTRVPDPAPYHEGKDFKTVILKEEDIPVVRLTGQFLKRIPEPVQPKPLEILPQIDPLRIANVENQVGQLATRFAGVEKQIDQIAKVVSLIAEGAGKGAELICKDCDKIFSTPAALGSHARLHK